MNTGMIRTHIHYTTREAWLADRARDITSTDVAALFGVSPYLTRYELWHRKVAGDVEPDDIGDVERVKWGTRLQDAIATGAAVDQDWMASPFTDYVRIAGLRIGSSFDYSISEDGRPRDPVALLECKNVDGLAFRDGWIETEYGLEAPSHIELQVQHQMLVSGIRKTYIAALVGGNRLVILERDYDEEIGERIVAECAAFWSGGEPAPDFRRDAALIAQLYRNAGGEEITASERVAQLMAEYNNYRRLARVSDDEADARKAEILTLIGEASRVTTEDRKYTLSCGTIGECEVKAHTRKSRRGFLVTKREAK